MENDLWEGKVWRGLAVRGLKVLVGEGKREKSVAIAFYVLNGYGIGEEERSDKE